MKKKNRKWVYLGFGVTAFVIGIISLFAMGYFNITHRTRLQQLLLG